MKIDYKVYCHDHTEEIDIVAMNTDSQDVIAFEIGKPCSQCQSEAYERGIESLLSKWGGTE